MLILVINSGSSSLKYQVRELDEHGQDTPDPVVTKGLVERIGEAGSAIQDHSDALDLMSKEIEGALNGADITAVGHRVVHGGERFHSPALVTDEVIEAIDALAPLAPLHNPPAVAGLRALRDKWPDVPQVVVFDTSFHQTMPEEAWRYAVPNSWYTDYGIRRYGFHGTSHDLVTGRTAELINVAREEFSGIILHLGNGASATAIRHGKSIDTTMGYTPLAGLVMGTRSGDVDPSVITQMITTHGYTGHEIDVILNKKSGLLGLAGESDMRSVLALADEGNTEAQVILDVASYRVAKYIGSYHVAVDGAQAISFTAGIGENSSPFRARVLDRLGILGVSYDPALNEQHSEESRLISTPDSQIPVAVVPTNEEMAIAARTYHVVFDENA